MRKKRERGVKRKIKGRRRGSRKRKSSREEARERLHQGSRCHNPHNLLPRLKSLVNKVSHLKSSSKIRMLR